MAYRVMYDTFKTWAQQHNWIETYGEQHAETWITPAGKVLRLEVDVAKSQPYVKLIYKVRED